MFEPQEWDEAFTAEREVQPRNEGAIAVNPEPDAVRDIEIAEREILSPRGDRAGIDEQRAIKRPPRLPSVLGGEEEAVAILETKLAETAKRLSAAKRGLKIERHVLSLARVGEDGPPMKRDGSIAIRNGNVLLELNPDATEAEGVQILIAVIRILHPVAPSLVWMQRVVSPLEGDRGVAAQDIGLLLVAGNRRGIEDGFGRGEAAVRAGANRWIEIREAAPDFEQVGDLPSRRRARLRAAQQIVRPILFKAVLTEAEEVFLGILVPLGMQEHVHGGASDSIEVHSDRGSPVGTRAVCAKGIELHTIRAVRVGRGANRSKRARVPGAESGPGAGGKSAARKLKAVPRLEDEWQRAVFLVVAIQRPFDPAALRRR